MAVTPLIDLATAKSQMNITGSDTDAEIGMYILAATEIVNSKCGYSAPTPITETVFTEGQQFSRARFILHCTPVLSVESIVPAQIGLLSTDMAQVTFDSQTGVVFLKNWFVFYGTFVVSYTAGRSEVPVALQLACGLIVQYMWETQRNALPLPVLGDSGEPLSPDGIPYRALALMRLTPYMAPGIA